jgi:hypothetical protein
MNTIARRLLDTLLPHGSRVAPRCGPCAQLVVNMALEAGVI